MLGYCVRCRAKQQMVNPTRTLMRNGRRAMFGPCECCGTKIYVAGSWDSDSRGAANGASAPENQSDHGPSEQAHDGFRADDDHQMTIRNKSAQPVSGLTPTLQSG